MGRYYALHDGEHPHVAAAIEQHYWPRFAGDALPEGSIAQCVALADKLESLVGMFGVGSVPTGDKDPFGLRRAALGVIRILMEAELPLPLPWLCETTQSQFPKGVIPDLARIDVRDFIVERLRGHLRDSDASPQEVDAVLYMHSDRIHLVRKILDELIKFNKLLEVRELAEMNKRVLNIIKKNREDLGFDLGEKVDEALLQEPAEKALYHQMSAIKDVLEIAWVDQDYGGYLRTLLGLKSPLATFFDKSTGVLVMDPDRALRTNRAGLLQRLGRMLNRVADISKLAV
jgi:glycyl-tRNA synthetase beta chain